MAPPCGVGERLRVVLCSSLEVMLSLEQEGNEVGARRVGFRVLGFLGPWWVGGARGCLETTAEPQ